MIEFLDRICPSLDREIGSSFQKILAKQGIQFKLNTKVGVKGGAGRREEVAVVVGARRRGPGCLRTMPCGADDWADLLRARALVVVRWWARR